MTERRDPAEPGYGSVPPPVFGPPVAPHSANPRPRRKRRILLLLAVTVVALAVAGAVALIVFWETAEDRYIAELDQAGLLAEMGSEEAAVAKGQAFCASLATGAETTGYESERIAVEHLCPDFLDGFEVVPTPEEQALLLTAALEEEGLGKRFPSEAAVAHAEKVCAALNAGEAPQGPAEDAVAVSIYCTEHEAGFRTLHPIKVDGTFTLLESDPSTYYPSIEGDGNDCSGTGGYGDIGRGTEIEVRDHAGTVLTTATLGKGTGTPPTRCEFSFSFTVMDGEKGYSVEVGDRGNLHYTAQQLKTPGAVAISLGE